MILKENYKLNNKIEIPKIGLGTWFISNEDSPKAVIDAINLGYRHIDTAQAYMNEKGIGEGIKESKVKREDLFITTKLAAEIKTYDEAVASIENSLKTLDLEYIDLMIIHSPQPWMEYGVEEDRCFKGNREAWKALEEAYNQGKLRAIGVSNFLKEDLENILDSCKIKPMVNQILAHIGNTPKELLSYCNNNEILVEAYSPIAHGELMKNEIVKKIANKYNISIPQLAIKYCLELGLLPLPKTSNANHMKNNAEINFSISKEDISILYNIDSINDYGDANIFPVYGGKLK